MLIDSHAHLTMSRFDADREDVLSRAREAGVAHVLTVGAEPGDWPRVVALARAHEAWGLYGAIGLHPHEASSLTEEICRELMAWAADPQVVALGETGFDFHYSHSPPAAQEAAFRRQIGIAREMGLPLVVHSREAEAETMRMLRQERASDVGGVLHCFSGSLEMARAALDLGFFISFSGSLTFKNADTLREVAAALPMERLLIETDCPYLAPQAVRGKRNEPAYVGYVAEALGALQGLTPKDIGRITSHNAMQLFSIGSMESDGKIAYRIRDALYLNVTNRCSNACGFCVRNYSDFVKGHQLRLAEEPSAEAVIQAVGDPTACREVVFCGYGEPLLRFDLVKNVSAWVKQRGGRVRVNTNGQGNLIHGRDILPELAGLVDAYSVSLNAENEAQYLEICRPNSGPGTYEAVKAFIREARRYADVSVTVVNLPGVDVERCRRIAEEELQVGFRLRYYDEVG